MLFEDDFAIGRWGSDGQDGLEGLLGGPTRFDAGEIIITGRVPGALYLDDLPGGMTALDRILPFQYVDGLPLGDVLDGQGGNAGEPIGEATASVSDPADPEAGPQAIIAAPKGDEEPLILVTQDDGQPLAGGFGDLDPTDFGRPQIDLIPVPPIVSVTPPDMTGGEQPAPVVPGGRAYQSLAFLILDTPYVVGDNNLPPSVRPPINELLGLPDDEEDIATQWVLPTGNGAWVLR